MINNKIINEINKTKKGISVEIGGRATERRIVRSRAVLNLKFSLEKV